MNDTKLCGVISRKLNGVGNLLDIGCENGLVSCLANKLNKKIIGLDISAKGFIKAHNHCKKFEACNLIDCIKGNAHNMKIFKNSEFDAITLVYALHHMNKPEIVPKEAKRILKPNKRIIMVEHIIRKRRSKCYKFVKEEISKMLENVGFRNTIIQRSEEDIILVTSKK
ncbi:MAG: class I SAM-dependent methyltransferase [Candidatus Diapherotrites archaeon]